MDISNMNGSCIINNAVVMRYKIRTFGMMEYVLTLQGLLAVADLYTMIAEWLDIHKGQCISIGDKEIVVCDLVLRTYRDGNWIELAMKYDGEPLRCELIMRMVAISSYPTHNGSSSTILGRPMDPLTTRSRFGVVEWL